MPFGPICSWMRFIPIVIFHLFQAKLQKEVFGERMPNFLQNIEGLVESNPDSDKHFAGSEVNHYCNYIHLFPKHNQPQHIETYLSLCVDSLAAQTEIPHLCPVKHPIHPRTFNPS